MILVRFSGKICVVNWTGVLLLSDPTTTSSHDDVDDGYSDATYQTQSKNEPGRSDSSFSAGNRYDTHTSICMSKNFRFQLSIFTKRTGLPVDLLAQEMYFLFQRISDTRGLITVALVDSSNL